MSIKTLRRFHERIGDLLLHYDETAELFGDTPVDETGLTVTRVMETAIIENQASDAILDYLNAVNQQDVTLDLLWHDGSTDARLKKILARDYQPDVPAAQEPAKPKGKPGRKPKLAVVA